MRLPASLSRMRQRLTGKSNKKAPLVDLGLPTVPPMCVKENVALDNVVKEGAVPSDAIVMPPAVDEKPLAPAPQSDKQPPAAKLKSEASRELATPQEKQRASSDGKVTPQERQRISSEEKAHDVRMARRRRRAEAAAAEPRTPRLSRRSRILSGGAELKHVMGTVPVRFRETDAQLVYSSADDGVSLGTLYANLRGADAVVLLVRDAGGATFGAFSAVPFRPEPGYSGSGEGFVFTVKPDRAVYPWTRANPFYQLCQVDSLAAGGGGTFALFLDSMLEKGESGPCDTYGNPCLASEPSFDVVVVEAYSLVVPSRLQVEEPAS